MRANGTSRRLLLDDLPAVQYFVLLKTFFHAEILELAFVTDGGKEAFAAGNVLLAVNAHLEALLVIFKADVGTELLDVGAEPYAVLAQTGFSH